MEIGQAGMGTGAAGAGLATPGAWRGCCGSLPQRGGVTAGMAGQGRARVGTRACQEHVLRPKSAGTRQVITAASSDQRSKAGGVWSMTVSTTRPETYVGRPVAGALARNRSPRAWPSQAGLYSGSRRLAGWRGRAVEHQERALAV